MTMRSIKKGKTFAFVACCCMAVLPLCAETIGWWRFNGTGTNVPNVANPGFLDGTIVAVSNDVPGEATIEQIAFTATPSKYPSITTNFQSVSPGMYDPVTDSAVTGGKTLTYGSEWVQGGVLVPYNDVFNFEIGRAHV